MRNIKFTTKEEYLQYRKDWKAEYEQLSQTIREKRWLHKEYSRIWNKAGIAHGFPDSQPWDEQNRKAFWDYHDLLEKENERYQTLKKKYEKDRKWVGLYSEEATAMLEELKEAKQEGQRQYLASKPQLQLA